MPRGSGIHLFEGTYSKAKGARGTGRGPPGRTARDISTRTCQDYENLIFSLGTNLIFLKFQLFPADPYKPRPSKSTFFLLQINSRISETCRLLSSLLRS